MHMAIVYLMLRAKLLVSTRKMPLYPRVMLVLRQWKANLLKS
jgi:hypothetical protein